LRKQAQKEAIDKFKNPPFDDCACVYRWLLAHHNNYATEVTKQAPVM